MPQNDGDFVDIVWTSEFLCRLILVGVEAG
jgi:hypothetical protein